MGTSTTNRGKEMSNNICGKFTEICEKEGVTVLNMIKLGAYLHIDTHKKDEPKLRELLSVMRPQNVTTLKPGVDGKHLDGSSSHRIVAKF